MSQDIIANECAKVCDHFSSYLYYLLVMQRIPDISDLIECFFNIRGSDPTSKFRILKEGR